MSRSGSYTLNKDWHDEHLEEGMVKYVKQRDKTDSKKEKKDKRDENRETGKKKLTQEKEGAPTRGAAPERTSVTRSQSDKGSAYAQPARPPRGIQIQQSENGREIMDYPKDKNAEVMSSKEADGGGTKWQPERKPQYEDLDSQDGGHIYNVIHEDQENPLPKVKQGDSPALPARETQAGESLSKGSPQPGEDDYESQQEVYVGLQQASDSGTFAMKAPEVRIILQDYMKGNLRLSKGDEVYLTKESGEECEVVMEAKRIGGSVPRTILAKKGSRELKFPWLVEDRTDVELSAIRKMTLNAGKHGDFWVRRSKSVADDYVLCVLVDEYMSEESKSNRTVKQYKIMHILDTEKYYIYPTLMFSSLEELVEHHKAFEDGLPCQLASPCQRAE